MEIAAYHPAIMLLQAGINQPGTTVTL